MKPITTRLIARTSNGAYGYAPSDAMEEDCMEVSREVLQ
jgi:hypothetical protein